MLVKMRSQQLREYWPGIVPMIEASIPEHVSQSPDGLPGMLSALTSGSMHGWAIFGKDVEDYNLEDIDGFMTTLIRQDEFTEHRYLLIYSLFGNRLIQSLLKSDILDALRKFARKKKCSKIMAYTTNEKLVKLVENVLGGKAEQRLIELEV